MGNQKDYEVALEDREYKKHTENTVMYSAEAKLASSEDHSSHCCNGCMCRGALFGGCSGKCGRTCQAD